MISSVVLGGGGGGEVILRNCLKLNEWLMWRTYTVIAVVEHGINFRPKKFYSDPFEACMSCL